MFELGSGHVGFAVNKAALGQVLRFPLPSIPSFPPHSSSFIISGAGIIGHLMSSTVVDTVPLHPKE
jgi:hypothetical protein